MRLDILMFKFVQQSNIFYSNDLNVKTKFVYEISNKCYK